jgi:hypothetical protein
MWVLIFCTLRVFQNWKWYPTHVGVVRYTGNSSLLVDCYHILFLSEHLRPCVLIE